MSLPRRSGKRRRSPSSGSDSFSGEGDSSVSPQLRGRPVLSPPPGLGRGRRLAGTGNSSNSGADTAESSRGRGQQGSVLQRMGSEGSRAMHSRSGAGWSERGLLSSTRGFQHWGPLPSWPPACTNGAHTYTQVKYAYT